MPRKSIAVIVAMRREVAPLLDGVRGQTVDRVEFFELETAVVAVGGIGREAAKRATEVAIEKYQPGALVSAGIAGALTATLKVGDVAHANEVVDVETGARFRTRGGESVIATASSVSGPAEKEILAERYKADVVDMESAVVAAVACEHGIEFAAIKAISDELEFEMPPLGRFVDRDGKFETVRFAVYVAIRPRWWSSVRQLGANSKLASVKLSQALQHLIRLRLRNEQEENMPLV